MMSNTVNQENTINYRVHKISELKTKRCPTLSINKTTADTTRKHLLNVRLENTE